MSQKNSKTTPRSSQVAHFKRNSVNNGRQILPLLLSATLGLIAAIVIFQSLAVGEFGSAGSEQNALSGSTSNSVNARSTYTSSPAHNGKCSSGQVVDNDNACLNLPTGTHSLIFDDEFTTTSVDTARWTVLNIHGDSNNNEQQCYIPQNVTENGGILEELLEVEHVSCPADTADGDFGAMTAAYSSGAIESKSFRFEYGTIEARIKFAGGSGSWPAFWLLGATCQLPNYLTANGCKWPNPGSEEIDIAEFQHNKIINEQVHTSNGSPGCTALPSNPATNWHVYSLTWHQDKLIYQIDGQTTCTISTSVPAEDMFIIVNTSAGGYGGGTINNTTLPQSTQVDFIRVFQ